MWDLIVSVPDHGLSFYFKENNVGNVPAKFQLYLSFSLLMR